MCGSLYRGKEAACWLIYNWQRILISRCCGLNRLSDLSRIYQKSALNVENIHMGISWKGGY